MVEYKLVVACYIAPFTTNYGKNLHYITLDSESME